MCCSGRAIATGRSGRDGMGSVSAAAGDASSAAATRAPTWVFVLRWAVAASRRVRAASEPWCRSRVRAVSALVSEPRPSVRSDQATRATRPYWIRPRRRGSIAAWTRDAAAAPRPVRTVARPFVSVRASPEVRSARASPGVRSDPRDPTRPDPAAASTRDAAAAPRPGPGHGGAATRAKAWCSPCLSARCHASEATRDSTQPDPAAASTCWAAVAPRPPRGGVRSVDGVRAPDDFRMPIPRAGSRGARVREGPGTNRRGVPAIHERHARHVDQGRGRASRAYLVRGSQVFEHRLERTRVMVLRRRRHVVHLGGGQQGGRARGGRACALTHLVI